MTQPLTAEPLKHSHRFDEGNPLAEKSTLRVAILTAVMMVVEITGGWYYNSMALLADGWHMSSHTVALGLSVFAYVYARKYAHDPRFSFGTWKIEVLGGYTSAIVLVIAGWIDGIPIRRKADFAECYPLRPGDCDRDRWPAGQPRFRVAAQGWPSPRSWA